MPGMLCMLSKQGKLGPVVGGKASYGHRGCDPAEVQLYMHGGFPNTTYRWLSLTKHCRYARCTWQCFCTVFSLASRTQVANLNTAWLTEEPARRLPQLGFWTSGFRAKKSDSVRLFALATSMQDCPWLTTVDLIQPEGSPGTRVGAAAPAIQAYTTHKHDICHVIAAAAAVQGTHAHCARAQLCRVACGAHPLCSGI